MDFVTLLVMLRAVDLILETVRIVLHHLRKRLRVADGSIYNR